MAIRAMISAATVWNPAIIRSLDALQQKQLQRAECEKGIVICTTGIGISIGCQQGSRIRCGLCADTYSAKMTREHNDANMLAMGAGIVGPNLALSIVETFLNTPFSGDEKHVRRINKIEEEVK